MTNYARIINNVAVDVSTDPQDHFTPDIAAEFVVVPDNVQPQWQFVSGTWQEPATVSGVTVYPELTPMQFYLAFTPQERIAIKNSTDPVVKEFWETYQLAAQMKNNIDPNLNSVVNGLEYLAIPTTASPAGPGILASTARVAQIQAGIAQ